MKLKLAENIRAFRKARHETQEQLAEAMGVSVSAVYKWESGLSVPEVGLILKLADLFHTSTDVLLGYEWTSDDLEAALRANAKSVGKNRKLGHCSCKAGAGRQDFSNPVFRTLITNQKGFKSFPLLVLINGSLAELPKH